MEQIGTTIGDDLKRRILSNAELILADRDLMRALVAASDQVTGDNVVDLRGLAMERLESQLARLEETQSSIIATAYDNLTGMNQIHRSVLKLLEPVTLYGFLTCLRDELPSILRVEALHLLMEKDAHTDAPVLGSLGSLLTLAEQGFINEYLTRGRDSPIRQITLRQTCPDSNAVFNSSTCVIRSEACLALDLGRNRPPGMLVFGSKCSSHFDSTQGTDLLAFFTGTFERILRRLLP